MGDRFDKKNKFAGVKKAVTRDIEGSQEPNDIVGEAPKDSIVSNAVVVDSKKIEPSIAEKIEDAIDNVTKTDEKLLALEQDLKSTGKGDSKVKLDKNKNYVDQLQDYIDKNKEIFVGATMNTSIHEKVHKRVSEMSYVTGIPIVKLIEICINKEYQKNKEDITELKKKKFFDDAE
jgi:hypothetical protein